ncbi:hypothetical protein ACFQ1E_01385 [Sphingomonas canadensis]|uniref:Uncharacterized protein n=1 Tax=Sphingomonas canadensis TaxID=1219257 RepID=A0ABW3H1F5_9SPHN|nr:hypothetical protein [Sphingomonas canadensis]MCW3835106.1 hypothetical protein [Sphingomonas canadensis]
MSGATPTRTPSAKHSIAAGIASFTITAALILAADTQGIGLFA